MEPETVSGRLGGETVVKEAGEAFRGNPDAVVLHAELHAAGRASLDSQGDDLVRTATFIRRIFGVSDQVDEHLQYLGLFTDNRWHGIELASVPDIVADQCG